MKYYTKYYHSLYRCYLIIPNYAAGTDCPVLGSPISGKKEGNDYNYGSIVKFGCSKGFVLRGSAIRRCMENGSWNGTEAICKGEDIS